MTSLPQAATYDAGFHHGSVFSEARASLAPRPNVRGHVIAVVLRAEICPDA